MPTWSCGNKSENNCERKENIIVYPDKLVKGGKEYKNRNGN